MNVSADELLDEVEVLEDTNHNLRAEIERLRAQLPDGMKHCTIIFKECERGHGRLTATNWVQHDECPRCTIERLETALKEIAGETLEERTEQVALSAINEQNATEIK